jgi:hypothetical protein
MDRTNETSKGYSYGGQNFTYQTKTDSQGNNYQVALPSTISTDSLATPPATIPVTQPQYNTATQQTQAGQAQAYTSGALADAENLQKQNEIAQRNEISYARSDLGKLQSEIGGKGQDLLTAYNQQDETGNSVNSLAGKLRTLNAKSQAFGLDTLAKQQQEINNATGQNITQTAVTRNTADATRQNLIDTARIAMESAIVKADYDTAKSYADQIVEAKYDQKLADIEAAKTNIDNIKENLTATEKKLADATTARLNKEQKDYEKKMADEKDVAKLIIDASPYAPSFVLSQAKKLQAEGKSAVEVAIALGKYGGDYLGDLVKRSTIAKNDADYQKTMKEIKALGQAPVVTAPAGTNANFIQNLAASAVNKESLSQSERTAVTKNLTVLDQLDSLQSNIAKQNSQGFVPGTVNNLLAKIGQNADVGTINAQLQAIVPNLARGVYGEVGVLTDNDIANYRKTLPTLTMPKDQNDAVLALTLKAVQKNLKNTLDTAANSKMDVSRFAPQYQQVTNKINEINDRIGVTKQEVLQYGRDNPQAQQMIADLSAQGMKPSQILQVLGVEN